MRPCQKCGSAIPIKTSVCPDCGAEQVNQFDLHATAVADPLPDNRWEDETDLHPAVYFVLLVAALAVPITIGFMVAGAPGGICGALLGLLIGFAFAAAASHSGVF